VRELNLAPDLANAARAERKRIKGIAPGTGLRSNGRSADTEAMVDTGPGYAPDLSRVDPEKLDAFKQALSEGDPAAMRSIAGEIGAAVSPSYGHRKEELR
jgi:hypothetical protein